MRSLRWSASFCFVTASNSRSCALSFGFRPGFRDARPASPLAPSCWRQDDSCELSSFAEHRLERAALAARERHVGGLHQPQLLGRRELAPHLGLDGLLRRAVHTGRTPPALGWGDFSNKNLGWLGHVSGTILRPSVQRYRGTTVSGTGGCAIARRVVTRRAEAQRSARGSTAIPRRAIATPGEVLRSPPRNRDSWRGPPKSEVNTSPPTEHNQIRRSPRIRAQSVTRQHGTSSAQENLVNSNNC
jgi:hypothetical protein